MRDMGCCLGQGGEVQDFLMGNTLPGYLCGSAPFVASRPDAAVITAFSVIAVGSDVCCL